MSARVVVIGNFDGVHTGHRHLIATARRLAEGGEVVALTFWPHPLTVVGTCPPLLTSLGERRALLTEAGADRVEVVDFTPEVAGWSPRAFIDAVIAPLRPDRIVVGENFTFGDKAAGGVDELRRLGAGAFEVTAVELWSGESDAATSSTRVRQALEAGDVEQAAELQGRPFRVSGVVVRGAQRGRELGFPTANLPAVQGRAVPADGVYAGWVTRLDQERAERWPAAISVGTNPTFDGVARTVEAYVLDRDDLELYDVPIAVDFVAHLRGQVKFEGWQQLIDQMCLDVDQARRLLDAARNTRAQEGNDGSHHLPR